MASGTEHRVGAAIALAAFQAHEDYRYLGHITGRTIAAAGGGLAFGTFPDLVEPAYRDPNHRRFFHSVALSLLLGLAVHRLYEWQPEDDADRFVRSLLLAAGGAYLIHLAMDAMTKRSLPLI